MRIWKKVVAVVLVIGILLSTKAVVASANESDALPVEIAARAAVLMDAATGQVLMTYNEHQRLYPASVTKVMTLLLVAEALADGKLCLTDQITVSGTAAGKGGSQIWLREGESMLMEDLLKAIAIYSANDASVALAEAIAGSEEGFVALMNERAAELGMVNTNFENSTGLDDTTENHLTTAYDIALMSRELLQHGEVIAYSMIWMDSLRDGETELVNTNRLVRFFEGATGLKTGTTSRAGCCISATAMRGDTHLIAVVLGSDNSNDRFDTAKRMLNWGFANYSTVTPEIDTNLITPVRVLHGEDRYITPVLPGGMPILVPRGSEDDLQQNIELALDVQAPVVEGQVLGRITVLLGDDVVGEYTLTAPEAVQELRFVLVLRRLMNALAR
ncbi:MAG: D-alanyl-D-alanine carboxypeptidase [Oscillospiraceae bacterium]|nr:D-alanyl-D-alanine carboxypeptidase [Oscillospiraceae bacterium]